jgi:hypothetical protein
MRYRPGTPALLLCLALSSAARAVALPQEESPKTKKIEPTKIEPTKAEVKQDERTKTGTPTAKPAPTSKITVRVKVSAEGRSALPAGSTIELKGDDPACGNLTRPEQSLEPDETTFPDLPVCKVKFRIYITSFDVKAVSVDLAKHKDPMKILVRKSGAPVVSFGSVD